MDSRIHKNNPNWKGGRLVPCIVCGIEKWCVPSKNRKFCSYKCSDAYKKISYKGRRFNLKGEFKIGQTSGDKHWNWKGGTTLLRETLRKSAPYQSWRRKILERDNFTCQLCGKISNGDINVDHYPQSFSEIVHKNEISSYEQALCCKELWRTDVNRVLCENCHRKTPTYLKGQVRNELGQYQSIYVS